MRVLLEIGPKGKRVVASAMDWPGLERWGRTEEEALDRMLSYVRRYAAVADRAGLAAEYAAHGVPEVVERTPGNTSTDWWGIAHVPSAIEAAEPLTADELERRIGLLRATWEYFDGAAKAASAPLAKGPRGGGRERDVIVRHAYVSERHNFWRKVGIREDDGVRLSPEELAVHRERFIDAIREYHATDRPARRWPLRFLIRRTAQHAMDHAWELEDRSVPASAS
jgi:hypothetical protein